MSFQSTAHGIKETRSGEPEKSALFSQSPERQLERAMELREARLMNECLSAVAENPQSAGQALSFRIDPREVRRQLERGTALEEALERDPDDSHALVALAEIHDYFGQRKEQLECLRRAYNSDPGSHDAATHLAVAHLESNEPHEAVQILESCLRITRGTPSMYITLGRALVDAEKNVEGRTAAQGRGPERVTLNDEGCDRLSAALSAFDKAITMGDADADVFVERGLVLKKLGRLPEAVSSFAHAMQLEPDNAKANLHFLTSTVEVAEGTTLAPKVRSGFAGLWVYGKRAA